jgi:hypothetical protein
MSTIRVNNLQNTSTTDGGISINASGHVTVDGVAMPSAGALSNRNIIINGAMQVAQRSTSETSQTGPGYKTCDRFLFDIQNLGTWTIEQSTDSPAGFSNSLKATCTTADASPAAGDYIMLSQRLEAQNLQHLAYGNSSAKQLTLSFWVKSNKTGSASFELIQIDNSLKLFSNSYTVSAADTWEQKTISIPADTAGAINNDNGHGLQLSWWLNSGSSFTGGSFQTTWGTNTSANRNVSNLGVGGATSDYFAITGVQLEVGSVATPFEHRSYGDELARCQRYYKRTSASSGGAYARMFPLVHMATNTVARCVVPLSPAMRARPSFNQSGTFTTQPSSGSPSFSLDTSGSPEDGNSVTISASSMSGTAGNAITAYANNDASAFVEFSAEL